MRTNITEEQLPSGRRCWYAEDPEMNGCCATGATISEAIDNLSESRRAWTDAARRLGLEIPTFDMANLETTITFVDCAGLAWTSTHC